MSDPVLVTGATGNTGSAVVAGLRSRGARVRPASRRPDPADPDALVFDWADPSTFGAALRGATAIYLVAPTGDADPLSLVRPFLELAAAHGVQRVVQLSSSAIERGEPGLGEIHDAVVELLAEEAHAAHVGLQVGQHRLLLPLPGLRHAGGGPPPRSGSRAGRPRRKRSCSHGPRSPSNSKFPPTRGTLAQSSRIVGRERSKMTLRNSAE